MNIKIFYDGVKYRLKSAKRIKHLIGKILEREGKIPGEINIIITDDESLRKINVEFLEHDYYTDVITFSYNMAGIINGEIYISINTVKENSLNYNVSLSNEILRVIIHGTLHLAGYNDSNVKERSDMRKLENQWMKVMEE